MAETALARDSSNDGGPKVTVGIPAHNAAPYLGAAIDSVLVQDFGDFELVVSDDASTDGTSEILGRYSDPRFRAVRSDERLGQSGNWNRCLESARGEFVVLLHADDELQPGFLRRAVSVLDASEDVGLVHCAVRHIDEAGKPLFLQALFDEDRIDREEVVLNHLLLDGCVINPAGVVVRRSVYERVGDFTEQIVWGVDWHMWIRIALRYPVAYMAEPLALYREHGQSGTTGVMASGRNARDEAWLVDDVFNSMRETRPDLYRLKRDAKRGVAHRTWCFAESLCEGGDMRAARIGIRNSVKISPLTLRKPEVWTLWFATYFGYPWFKRLHAGKQRLAARLRVRASGP
jgi:glycosyltransferase involved in cell wall biosynthesis